jgi:hypothetical protein
MKDLIRICGVEGGNAAAGPLSPRRGGPRERVSGDLMPLGQSRGGRCNQGPPAMIVAPTRPPQRGAATAMWPPDLLSHSRRRGTGPRGPPEEVDRGSEGGRIEWASSTRAPPRALALCGQLPVRGRRRACRSAVRRPAQRRPLRRDCQRLTGCQCRRDAAVGSRSGFIPYHALTETLQRSLCELSQLPRIADDRSQCLQQAENGPSAATGVFTSVPARGHIERRRLELNAG